MTIYIGNLSYEANEQDVQELFSQFGEVSSVKLIKDNTTGRSKGFGFVEMADVSLSKRAIAELHETEFMSRNIVVNEARPKTTNDRSSFNRGGKGFGNSRYNRNSY
ncbi:MAG: RNA-binding protein [Bacteroidota bacterium]